MVKQVRIVIQRQEVTKGTSKLNDMLVCWLDLME